MRMLEIQDSSNVQAVGYEPTTTSLDVRFRNGGHYRYAGVTPDEFARLVSAESLGIHLHARIKPNHPFTRIEGDEITDQQTGHVAVEPDVRRMQAALVTIASAGQGGIVDVDRLVGVAREALGLK